MASSSGSTSSSAILIRQIMAIPSNHAQTQRFYIGGRLVARQKSTRSSMTAAPAHMTLSAAPQ